MRYSQLRMVIYIQVLKTELSKHPTRKHAEACSSWPPMWLLIQMKLLLRPDWNRLFPFLWRSVFQMKLDLASNWTGETLLNLNVVKTPFPFQCSPFPSHTPTYEYMSIHIMYSYGPEQNPLKYAEGRVQRSTCLRYCPTRFVPWVWNAY